MSEEIEDLQNELDRANSTIKDYGTRILKVISYVHILKNTVRDFETEYKEDFLNMLDDISNILEDEY